MQTQLKRIQISDCTGETNLSTPRIWLSTGTLPACQTRSESTLYCDNAFIPLEPWREPTSTEHKAIIKYEASNDRSTCVGLVRLPDDVLGPFERLGLGAVMSNKDRDKLTKHPTYPTALTGLITYLGFLSRSEYAPQVVGIAVNPPRLCTVTANGPVQSYLGLRVDNWDRLPFHQRSQARNRICINLGRENRYLLFIDLPLRDLLPPHLL